MLPFFIAGAPMHGMNCVDIVIGTARGTQFRVFDYYTCDRSTPLFDEMYGGSQGITAAIGVEAKVFDIVI